MGDVNQCEFCGQVLLDDEPCDCSQAKKQRKIDDQISRAKDEIEQIFVNCEEQGFEPVAETALELMRTAAVKIAQRDILQVQITINSKTKAKFSLSTKGSVNVERVETQRLAAEVTE